MFIRLTFLFLVLPPAAAWAQAPSTALDLAARLAYFSPQRAFAISADGKAAQSTLAALEAQNAKAIEARNLETTFYAKLRPAIGAVVKERGLLFLFNEDAGTLTWADPALDVTADIVKRLDRP